MSSLVRNPDYRFFHNSVHIYLSLTVKILNFQAPTDITANTLIFKLKSKMPYHGVIPPNDAD